MTIATETIGFDPGSFLGIEIKKILIVHVEYEKNKSQGYCYPSLSASDVLFVAAIAGREQRFRG